MSTTGKIYLGDTLVSDPSSGGGGGGVEYVTFTFSGGNTFKFCGLTDQGYLDDYTINGSGTLNVVKDSICFIGRMEDSLNFSKTPNNLTMPRMTYNGSSYTVGAGQLCGCFITSTPTRYSSYVWEHVETVIADQDITFYADVD